MSETSLGMEGLGKRLRFRAQELGLSDAEVARRAGLTATRYGHYVTDYREPDLATLLRICRVLGSRPDELLAFDQRETGKEELSEQRRKATGFLVAMDDRTLELALPVIQALAATARLREQKPDMKEDPRQGKVSTNK